MKAITKIVIIVALSAAIVGVLALKEKDSSENDPASMLPEFQGKPMMIDLGSETCIPCKMMVPVLEELKQSHDKNFTTEFRDTTKHEFFIDHYKIKIIPTQIYFAADGKELFRHEGPVTVEQVLSKWKELGYDFTVAE